MKYLVLLVTLAGCSSMTKSVMVKENAEGGRVMLHGTGSIWEEDSHKKALASMNAKCPEGYEVIETGMMPRPSSMPGVSGVMEKYFEFRCK